MNDNVIVIILILLLGAIAGYLKYLDQRDLAKKIRELGDQEEK